MLAGDRINVTSKSIPRLIICFSFSSIRRPPKGGVSGVRVQRFVRSFRNLIGLDTDDDRVAGRTSTPVFSSAESIASRTRVLREDDRRERLVGAATRVMGQGVRPVPPARTRQRAMLNVRHHVELEPTTQPHQLPFRGPGLHDAGRKLVRDWTPSSQLSRGSFRSDVSDAVLTRYPVSQFSPKSSHGVQQSGFVHTIVPLSSYPDRMEQMRSASAATLTGGHFSDLSFTRRPVSAFEQSPAGRPSPFPRSEPAVLFEDHIYQNQMQAMGRMQRPTAGPIPFQSSNLFSVSIPFNRSLILRDSQRRRFDDRIAQIRRERESTRVGRIRPQMADQSSPSLPQPPEAAAATSSPVSSLSEDGDERLCQV